MTPSGALPDLRLYANMALDAYDPRTRTNDPGGAAEARTGCTACGAEEHS